MPRVCVIQINVTDLDEAMDFYVNKLGFEVVSREHYPHLVKLSGETLPVLLYRVDRRAADEYPNSAQTLMNIETEDLQGTLARLRNEGVEVVHDEPQACPVGIYAALRDPSGNVVELVEYRREP